MNYNITSPTLEIELRWGKLYHFSLYLFPSFRLNLATYFEGISTIYLGMTILGVDYLCGLCTITTKIHKKMPVYIKICVKTSIFVHKIYVYGMEQRHIKREKD